MSRTAVSPLENFYNHVWMVDDGCWIWTGAYREQYGVFTAPRNGKSRAVHPAHTWSYWLHVGEFAEGLELDHLCKKPSCVNPKHLEPVTPTVNKQRSDCPSGINFRKTHCLNGHALVGDNLYSRRRLLKSGEVATHRLCKTCQRARNEAHLARKRGVT